MTELAPRGPEHDDDRPLSNIALAGGTWPPATFLICTGASAFAVRTGMFPDIFEIPGVGWVVRYDGAPSDIEGIVRAGRRHGLVAIFEVSGVRVSLTTCSSF